MDARLHSNLLWSIAIFVAAVVAFEPALFNTYTFDDIAQVRELAVPDGARGVLRAAVDPWWPPERGKNLWRPVTRLSILIQKAVAGPAPWTFYALNIILHGAVAVLLFLLVRRLGLGAAAAGLGALVFAVHPAHAEAVHQVVGRAELLAALFMLAGLLLSMRFGVRGWQGWVAQPLCFALALGAKEHAMVYPLLLVLAGIAGQIKDGKDPKDLKDEKDIGIHSAFRIPHSAFHDELFWGLLAVLLLVFALFLKGKAAITGGVLESPASVPYYENPLAAMGLVRRLPAALGALGYAASRMIWPVNLAPDYSAVSLPFERGWTWPYAWVGGAVLLITILYMIRNALRGGRGWALAAAALGSYLLVSNLFFTIGVSTAQRLWYWPSSAVCLGLGWALAAAGARLSPERRRVGFLFVTALLTALVAAGWGQAVAWRSPEHFARATIKLFPESWRGRVDTARACYRERDFASGREHAREATRIFPDLADGWAWLGSNAMFIAGRQGEAEAAFKVALTLDPELYETHRHYGHLLRMQGRRAEAVAQLQAFLEAPEITEADREKVMREIEEMK